MWLYPSTLLFGTEETLVIVRFPLTVNVAKLQNNACITAHTQFPIERRWSHPRSCCSGEDLLGGGGILCLNLQWHVVISENEQFNPLRSVEGVWTSR